MSRLLPAVGVIRNLAASGSFVAAAPGLHAEIIDVLSGIAAQ
jgi:hypothetical protein